MKSRQTYFLLLIIAVVVIALAFGNPYATAWPLKCPLYCLTGLQCPICGIQRAMHELLHGNLMMAWQMNKGLLLASPYLIVLLLGQLNVELQSRRIVKECYRNRSIFVFLIYMLMWGVIRNIT